MQELRYKIAFASISGMGIDLAKRLLDVVGNEEQFFSYSEEEIKTITGGRSRVYKSDYRRKQLERAERELDTLIQKNITPIYYTDDRYPARLKEACDAPLILYTTGNCNLNAAHIVSIVGPRHATSYGQRMCGDIVGQLAEKIDDLVIVSGLAYGIDIAAHRAALHNNTPTVAVMARGLNKVYPAEHRTDAANIVRQGGMCVTDYMCQDELHRGNFLARNRIIAGMADCTVVIESAATGGALVTASLALSYDRDVFAVPGRVNDEFSRGCNRLIHNNQALSIASGDDIINAMSWETKESVPRQMEIFPTFTAEEQRIVDVLKQNGDMHINAIASQAGLPVHRAMSAVMELECKGAVLSLPGSRYAINL